MNRKKALELIDRGLNAEGLDKGELWKLCLYQARMLIKLVAELDKKEKYAAHLEELFGCDPAYFEPDGVQTKMKPESRPQTKTSVPDGLIDPKSYYQGFEDGRNSLLKPEPNVHSEPIKYWAYLYANPTNGTSWITNEQNDNIPVNWEYLGKVEVLK